MAEYNANENEEAALFQFSCFLSFRNGSIQQDFEARNLKINTACKWGSLFNILYYLTTAMITQLSSFDTHMGGIGNIFILLGISILQFLIVYICQRICCCCHQSSNRKPWNSFFLTFFSPVIIYRSVTYLIAIRSYDWTSPIPAVFEMLSLWFYVYFGYVAIFIASNLNFRFIFIISSLAVTNFLFSFVWYLEEYRFFEAAVAISLCAMGTGVTSLLYIAQKRALQTYIWKCRHRRSVAREQMVDFAKEHQKIEHLTKAAKEKSLIFGQLAHDIGTPISALSMAIELLEEAAEKRKQAKEQGEGLVMLQEQEEEQLEIFDAINASLGAIQVLRQSMIDYVKKANGILLKPSFEVLDLEKLMIKQAFPILRQLLGKQSEVTPVYSIDEALQNITVSSAENWILDMLFNYISNAAKFTKKGFIEIHVRLKEPLNSGELEMLLFEVKDSGPGISSENYGNLFKTFSQLQDDCGGTGLGLASVKNKAVMLGGDAGFYNNEDGPGATFFFMVPVSQNSRSVSREAKHRQSTMTVSEFKDRSIHTTSSPFCRNSSYRHSKRRLIYLGDDKVCSKSTANPRVSTKHVASDGAPFAEITSEESKANSTLSGKNFVFVSEDALEESSKLCALSSACINPARSTRTPKENNAQARSIIKQELAFGDTLISSESKNDAVYLTAMVVDDSPVLLSLYARLSRKAGVSKVLKAESGEECMQQLFNAHTPPVDLILMDDKMAGTRGPECARQIKQCCEKKQLPFPKIYICTGSTAGELEQEFCDIYDFVQEVCEKPLSLEDIRRIVTATVKSDFDQSYQTILSSASVRRTTDSLAMMKSVERLKSDLKSLAVSLETQTQNSWDDLLSHRNHKDQNVICQGKDLNSSSLCKHSGISPDDITPNSVPNSPLKTQAQKMIATSKVSSSILSRLGNAKTPKRIFITDALEFPNQQRKKTQQPFV